MTRDTVELFVRIRRRKWRKVPDWQARCKMIGCDWTDTAATEIMISKKWITHFQQVYVGKWDVRT